MLKFKIPRRILDLFLDCSLTIKAFEKGREELFFDTDDPAKNKIESVVNNHTTNFKWSKNLENTVESNPELAYYYNNRGNFKNKIDEIKKQYTKLKLDSKPFVPKGSMNISQTTCDIDKSDGGENLFAKKVIKEYTPRNYRLIKLVDSDVK